MISHRSVQANGLAFRISEAGSGPLVLLCHGFPELGHSWRFQLDALAAAGFHAVAPDLRGYGGSDAPADPAAYTIFHLVGDVVGLVAALGRERAHLVGHDWGAALAWQAALMRPDVFPTVACMSVPFQPRREGRPPIAAYREITRSKGLGEFYIVAFQAAGVEAAFEADVERSMRLFFHKLDGATPAGERFRPFRPEGTPLLDDGAPMPPLPAWLGEADLGVFVEAFGRRGFGAPLAWYRNIDRNWELGAPFQGAQIRQPAFFVTGENDPVRLYAGAAEKALAEAVPGLVAAEVVPGAGHWLQQEAAGAVNEALLRFLQPRRELA